MFYLSNVMQAHPGVPVVARFPYQALLWSWRDDPAPLGVLLRQLLVQPQEVGEPAHHPELHLLERPHVGPGLNPVSQKAES